MQDDYDIQSPTTTNHDSLRDNISQEAIWVNPL